MAKKPSLKAALGRVKERESKIKEAEKKEQRMVASQEASDKKAKAKAKKVMPFDEDDRILLLGEANFSFTLALLTAHPVISPVQQVIATSFDSEETCYTKYPDAQDIVNKIRELGVPVLFEVDAGDLEAVEEIRKMKGGFTKVVFNFPHVGLGEKSQSRNVILNQALILRFLRSVPAFLSQGRSRIPSLPTKKPRYKARGKGKGREKSDQDGTVGGGASGTYEPDDDELDGVSDLDEDEMMAGEAGSTSLSLESVKNQKGVVLITLRDAVPYTLWDLPHLFTRPPPPPPVATLAPSLRPTTGKTSLLPATQPRYALLRSFAFHPTLYPGYAHRRTIGFKDGVSKSDNEEIEERGGGRTWEAEVVDESLVEENEEEDGGESKSERVERRRKELREEKRKAKHGNGWGDKRPVFKEPKGDKGWNDRGFRREGVEIRCTGTLLLGRRERETQLGWEAYERGERRLTSSWFWPLLEQAALMGSGVGLLFPLECSCFGSSDGKDGTRGHCDMNRKKHKINRRGQRSDTRARVETKTEVGGGGGDITRAELDEDRTSRNGCTRDIKTRWVT